MGGCRCTYRNCTVRSDGVTHMFHYPVFNKVRCHEWLTNAQKFEFLDLKVSQLRNRVVCQNHFKDDCFMNHLKQKLKFTAVPTEDGPYCDSSELPSEVPMSVANLTRDFIESEYLTYSDKKANFPVKYGDFLTNCEVMDLVNLDIQNQVNVNDNLSKDEYENFLNLSVESDKVITKKKSEQNAIMMPLSPTTQPCILNIDYQETPPKCEVQEQIEQNNEINTSVAKAKAKKKIEIISEKTLSGPVKVTGKLTPVSPSIIIECKEKNKLNNVISTNVCIKEENTSIKGSSAKPHSVSHVTDYIADIINDLKREPIEQVDLSADTNQILLHSSSNQLHPVSANVTSKEQPSNKTMNQTSKVSYLKPKIPPERVAAIKEKRQFNMKLKDYMENSFENVDDSPKVVKDEKKEESQDSKIPDNTIASLEARLKRMEDLLLNKINQNSEKIAELTRSLPPKNELSKRTCAIQTIENEDMHKRQLYQDMSKYLSPEAKSMVYEELFLNNIVSKKLPSNARIESSPKKRRKCIIY